MFELPEFEDKDIVFIGQGKEWKSFGPFIQDHAAIRSIKSIFISKENTEEQHEFLKNLDFTKTIVVKAPGYPGRLVPAPYTTPTKVFFECVQQIHAKTVGITGTKGKTTTTALLAHILKNAGMDVHLAGNIGKPMLDTLKDASERSVFVLELSSYQLAELETSPDVAIITNLYRDHIDYHGSLEAYWEAKRNIMRYMDSSGAVVFNPETEVVFHWLAESEAKQVAIDPNETVDMSKSKLIGEHNRVDYLLARTAAQLLGVDRLTSASALNSFQPIPHRLQIFKTLRGVTYIDDAIASTPEAAMAGITACVREVGPVGCVFLGGQDRDYDFSGLVTLLSTLMIPKLVLFPDTGAKIKAMLPDNYTPELFETEDMSEAVTWAAEHVPSGSVCLLSSAAPSYSLWKDFEEKGALFQDAVNNL